MNPFSWSRSLPFLSLLLVQVLVVAPMLSYHRGLGRKVLLLGLLCVWFTVLFQLVHPKSPAGSALLRLASSLTLAATPFAWYELRYGHGCRITFEDSPIFLVVILVGPILVWRWLLPVTVPLVPDQASQLHWSKVQWQHSLLWLACLHVAMLATSWLPLIAKLPRRNFCTNLVSDPSPIAASRLGYILSVCALGRSLRLGRLTTDIDAENSARQFRNRFHWELAALGSLWATLGVALLFAPGPGISGVFRQNRIPPHMACGLTAMLPLAAILESP